MKVMKEIRVVVPERLYNLLSIEAVEKDIKISELVRRVLNSHFDEKPSKESVLIENNFWRTTLIMEQLWHLFKSLEMNEDQEKLIKENTSIKIEQFYKKKGLKRG